MRVMTKDTDSEEEVESVKEESFISKWFGGVSGDESDHTTVHSGESEFTSDYESGSSYDEESTADEAFDRKLRAKHTKACKYMRVSFVSLEYFSGIPRDIVPRFLTLESSLVYCCGRQNGDFQNALIAFESIHTSLLEAYGAEHHRVGAALHNVGIANLRAGKLDDAMASIEEAVRMRKSTLGETHPKVAVSIT